MFKFESGILYNVGNMKNGKFYVEAKPDTCKGDGVNMKGQERFRAELAQLQDYCQKAFQRMDEDVESMDTVQDVCSELRALVGRLFGIAEEMNDLMKRGDTVSENSSGSEPLFDCIHSFRRPNVYYDLLAFEEAIRELRRVLDESEDRHVIAAAYNGLGHIYAVRKMYPLAIHYFSKVVEYYPENSDGYFNLGAAWFNLGSYDEARHYFHKAVYHHPKDWEAYFQLGRAYEKMGDADSAVYYMHRAREIKYDAPGMAMVTG